MSQGTERLRVLMVDDHTLLVESLSMVLSMQDVEAVRTDLTSPAAVVEQAREASADLVLLDLDLGGAVGSGEDLIEPLRADGHRVLVVTGSHDDARLGRCLSRGALGVLPKSMPVGDLVAHVVAGAQGRPVMSEGRKGELLAAAREAAGRDHDRQTLFDRLSDREKAVLGALVDGDSVGRIAAESVVSEATVRTQVRAILNKLGVNSQLEAVAIATRHGWFRLS